MNRGSYALAALVFFAAVTTPNVLGIPISITVPSTAGGNGVSTPVLHNGTIYLFEATGVYSYGHSDWADAEFLSFTGKGPLEYHPDIAADVCDLTINGEAVDWLGGSNWQPHTYSWNHTYRYVFTGTGAPAKLAIADWEPLIPGTDYTFDNAGALSVTITALTPEPPAAPDPVPDGPIPSVLLLLVLAAMRAIHRVAIS